MERTEKAEGKGTNPGTTGHPEATQIMKMVKSFLGMFMCETLVKRILGVILVAAGLSNDRVTEMTGLCDRSVRSLRKAVESGDTERLFIRDGVQYPAPWGDSFYRSPAIPRCLQRGRLFVSGGGRKSKLRDVEAAIVEEIGNSNYHSRQQIADMIQEKYGIKVSLPAVGRLLKKTASND